STCRDDAASAGAYGYIYRWKGLLINSLRMQREISRLMQADEYKDSVQSLKHLRNQIARRYQEAGTVPYSEWQAKNQQLTSEKESLERQLARAANSGAVSDIFQGKQLSDFIALLKPGEALIDVYRYQS